MAVYTDVDGERKYLPQYFKFLASNPLSVRTKVHSFPRVWLNLLFKFTVIEWLRECVSAIDQIGFATIESLFAFHMHACDFADF